MWAVIIRHESKEFKYMICKFIFWSIFLIVAVLLYVEPNREIFSVGPKEEPKA
jgi:hypothetical protein